MVLYLNFEKISDYAILCPKTLGIIFSVKLCHEGSNYAIFPKIGIKYAHLATMPEGHFTTTGATGVDALGSVLSTCFFDDFIDLILTSVVFGLSARVAK